MLPDDAQVIYDAIGLTDHASPLHVTPPSTATTPPADDVTSPAASPGTPAAGYRDLTALAHIDRAAALALVCEEECQTAAAVLADIVGTAKCMALAAYAREIAGRLHSLRGDITR